MKFGEREFERFLRKPDPAVRAALLYGSDLGLIRERADALARGVVADLSDPFRVVDLAAKTVRDDPARLADEAAALAFTGGRKLVRIRDAGDGLAEATRALFAQTGWEALVVVEAPELARRSKLVELFEEADDAAAIGCYPDREAGTERVIEETLARHGLSADVDALAFLSEHLGGDRSMTRSEAEKLALYCHGRGKVTRADAVEAVGDSALVGIDDAVLSAFDGEGEKLSRALSRLRGEGVSPAAVIVMAQKHCQRLQLLVAAVAAGTAPASAIRALRPPVFFETAASFERQAKRWRAASVARALATLTDADLKCRSTGTPSHAVAGQALQVIALMAQRESATR
jgi:DNA polymerase III subunit delta